MGWERDEYAIFEFIGESDLGLLACVTVEDVVSPITLFVDTEDITAQGTFVMLYCLYYVLDCPAWGIHNSYVILVCLCVV